MADEPEGDIGSPPSEAIRDVLRALEDKDGRVTPETVVDAAADPSSPLHEHFEWNEGKAAHAYRLEQARRLIRAVRVVVTIETRAISTVHYVRDPKRAAEEQGYVSLTQLRSEPDTARAMLHAEFARAAACLRRAEDLADALGLRGEAALRRVERARRRLDAQPSAHV